jgi:hypothetical protein
MVAEVTAEKLEPRIYAIECLAVEHDKWINGNGNVGAKVTLALLSQKVEEIGNKIDSLTKAVVGLIMTIAGAIIVYILIQVIPHVSAGLK